MKQGLEWSGIRTLKQQEKVGLRFGNKGTHTSRTLMLSELGDLLTAVPQDATNGEYAVAIVNENVLGKVTGANRRMTDQRLGELYGLDRSMPIFRVLRRLWDIDASGRPLLALVCALARDPLLRATAPVVIALEPGEELRRTAITGAVREATGSRLNESSADKVARNAGSSWTQAGFLEGRVRKIRCRVRATPGAAAFALWLGTVQGLAGEDLFDSAWMTVLDADRSELLDLTLRAKQLGLLSARVGGDVIEIDARGVDPVQSGG